MEKKLVKLKPQQKNKKKKNKYELIARNESLSLASRDHEVVFIVHLCRFRACYSLARSGRLKAGESMRSVLLLRQDIEMRLQA